MMIKRFIKNREFEKNALILFVSLMIGNLSNYVFQIIMARFLSVDQFGTVNVLFSFLTVILLPIPVLILVVTKYIAESVTLGEGYISSTFRFFLKYNIIISIVFGLILLLAIVPIAEYLAITNYLYLVLTITTITLSYMWISFYGLLQGAKDFIKLSILYFMPALGKLFFGIIVLYFGYEIFGIMLTMIVTAFLPIILGFKFSRNLIDYDKKNIIIIDKKEIIIYCFVAGAVSISNGLLTSLDLLFIKHYFTSYDTGLYSSAAILGKLMVHIPVAFSSVMFPAVITASKLGDNYFKMFIKTLLYCFLLIIIAIFMLNFFSELIISFLFGIQYVRAAEYVFPVSIVSGLLGILSIIITFFLAINRTKFLSATLFVSVIFYASIVSASHDTIYHIVYILIGIVCTVIFINIVYIGLLCYAFFNTKNVHKL